MSGRTRGGHATSEAVGARAHSGSGANRSRCTSQACCRTKVGTGPSRRAVDAHAAARRTHRAWGALRANAGTSPRTKAGSAWNAHRPTEDAKRTSSARYASSSVGSCHRASGTKHATARPASSHLVSRAKGARRTGAALSRATGASKSRCGARRADRGAGAAGEGSRRAQLARTPAHDALERPSGATRARVLLLSELHRANRAGLATTRRGIGRKEAFLTPGTDGLGSAGVGRASDTRSAAHRAVERKSSRRARGAGSCSSSGRKAPPRALLGRHRSDGRRRRGRAKHAESALCALRRPARTGKPATGTRSAGSAARSGAKRARAALVTVLCARARLHSPSKAQLTGATSSPE